MSSFFVHAHSNTNGNTVLRIFYKLTWITVCGSKDCSVDLVADTEPSFIRTFSYGRETVFIKLTKKAAESALHKLNGKLFGTSATFDMIC